MITEEELRKNYETVLNNIRIHAEKVGRNCDEIKLVAVTKTQPIEVLNLALNVGIKVFGENYAQELRDKAKVLQNLGIEWHFIGRIQTNKVKYIVPVAKLIHSVYRLEELEEIDKVAKKLDKTQLVLLEVNVSGEETKAGLQPEQVRNFLIEASKYTNVKIVGLMTMAPYIEPEMTRVYFKKLRALRDELKSDFPDIVELSMGMTNDYTVAVEEGSTIVRIGTALFGERKSKR
ncbi:pyridoxal phosphate enzyme, YggS family [Fervidobacterium pennivorans DSM 9078]|uniref:Pyridoxal phosphate homeostasis protein n=1 Tax=Fervidobacterium pennivorans (strain DSM 9078 / Ven5) TaxID=771875 RepID=H9UAJ1_FERPD|nr:pyridoxal phosphate enzyme, YggS family [Fervidobacterium pennivorans DSM 9078]